MIRTNISFSGKGNTNVPGFEIPPVEDLLWGQTVSGKNISLFAVDLSI